MTEKNHNLVKAAYILGTFALIISLLFLFAEDIRSLLHANAASEVVENNATKDTSETEASLNDHTAVNNGQLIEEKEAVLLNPKEGTVTHQGDTYQWKVMLDGKKWLTSNLKVWTLDSWCYKNDSAYCEKFGRLYTWEAAKEGCSALGEGWRLPTDEDWKELANLLGGYEDVAYCAKWRKYTPIGDPQKAYRQLIKGGAIGFEGLEGGYRTTEGKFTNANYTGYYWTSTEGKDPGFAYKYGLYNNKLYWSCSEQIEGVSVRCVKGS